MLFLFSYKLHILPTITPPSVAPPSDATIARKTRKLVLEDGHVSCGMNYLCRHAEKDKTATPLPQMSDGEFQDRVATLHPKRQSTHDSLDLVSDCPTDPNLDSLKLKATTLNTTIRRLKRDCAPGFVITFTTPSTFSFALITFLKRNLVNHRKLFPI